jgi:hypothetical protein
VNPGTVTVTALQAAVFAFAEQAFGPGREDAAWKKLFEELGEVLKKPRDPMEWGDVFILLFDLARIYGIDVDAATLGKLELIKDRVWRQTETGTYQHVPGASAAADRAACLFYVVVDGGPLAGPETPAGTLLHIDLSKIVAVFVGEDRVPEAPQVLWFGDGCYNWKRRAPKLGDRGVMIHHYEWDANGVPF